jgi:hypothetical protein
VADPVRTIELRRAAFERAGFSAEAARELAERQEIDLRSALSLVKHGFPPEVAYELLRAGDRPVF